MSEKPPLESVKTSSSSIRSYSFLSIRNGKAAGLNHFPASPPILPPSRVRWPLPQCVNDDKTFFFFFFLSFLNRINTWLSKEPLPLETSGGKESISGSLSDGMI